MGQWPLKLQLSNAALDVSKILHTQDDLIDTPYRVIRQNFLLINQMGNMRAHLIRTKRSMNHWFSPANRNQNKHDKDDQHVYPFA